MQFVDLGLCEPILRAVASEGYGVATPVQAQAIPHVLKGRDVMGCAQTGTGKTAAFALPILHRLAATAPAAGPRRVRALILCPTRELATQIGDSFRVYGKNLGLRSAVIFGGVGQNPQVAALRHGLDILVATPGRLLDLMEQGFVDLRGVSVLVLDEADRMLDMGFIFDIRRIVAKLPTARQTLMFSATMPPEIRTLANSVLHDPLSVQVAPVSSTAEGIDESVYFVEKGNKAALLAHLVGHLPMTRAIVFTRTKRGADKVVKHLHSRGIRAEAIHSNKSQNARQRALGNFKANKMAVLVATDIASRGIDVDGITHVVNYDLSNEPETYVHRIGRTARAGASGAAVSFCDKEELPHLRAIEKLIRRSIPSKNERPPVSAAQRAEAPAGAGRPHQAPRPHAAAPQRNSQQRNSPGPRHPARPPHGPVRPGGFGGSRAAHPAAGGHRGRGAGKARPAGRRWHS